MPRTARIAPGGVIYHVLNRGVGGMKLFDTPADYEAFLRAVLDTLKVVPMRILAFCIMPNHWHLLLWPQRDRELARFMMRLTTTHARRWIEFRGLRGRGHVYQGRYKSFAVQSDEHLLIVARYIVRNALRARLVRRAERWLWSSLGQHANARIPLCDWPVTIPGDWIEWVNQPQTAAELEAIRRSVREERPFGDDAWRKKTMTRLGWRERQRAGRPRKKK